MRPDRNISEVYLHRKPVDMRRQMDGLSAVVQGAMHLNPMSGALFVFISKRRDRLKILYWERTGFALWYKRLEEEKFKWPVKADTTVVTLNGEQLNWLLDGYDVMRMKAHKILHYEGAG